MTTPLDGARPVTDIPAQVCRELRVVASDIDDTISTDGRIPADAYAALWRLREAGIAVVPVTGRPAGWCDLIARMWPVDGVVGENGALYFRHVPGEAHGTPGRIVRHYVLDAAARAANRERLARVATEILAAVPGSAIAADQAYREFDLAIDFCEDVPRLPDAAVDRIVAVFEKHGCTAKVSSIHVNGWFGDYDKLGMVKTFLARELGIDAEAERGRVLFCGDSPNDEPMFGFFPHSVGMANIADFRTRVRTPPTWVAAARGGEGFAETVDVILRKRR